MFSLRRPAASGLVSVLVAGLVVTAAPATAEEYTQVDAVRDVTTHTFDIETGEETFTTDPSDAATDILRVRFDFRDSKLVVRATLRSSAPRTRAFLQLRAAGDDYFLSSTRPGRIRVSANNGPDRGCRGGLVTFRAATIRLVVPLVCVGDPASARLGFAVTRVASRDRAGASIGIDDAGRTGFPENAENLKLGPRIRRG